METSSKVLWSDWVLCDANGEIARFDSLKAAQKAFCGSYAMYLDRVDTLGACDQYGDHVTVRFAVSA